MQTATEENIGVITRLFILDLPRIGRVSDELNGSEEFFELLPLAAENNQ